MRRSPSPSVFSPQTGHTPIRLAFTISMTSWRNRHYAMKAVWLREKIAELQVKLKHTNGKELVSDCLTKVLPKDLLTIARKRLGLQ